MKWALKVSKKDTSLAKKQEKKYQRLMTAISLELVIIVVKSIILKNHITKDEKDIFVAENVIQNIGQNYSQVGNNFVVPLVANSSTS